MSVIANVLFWIAVVPGTLILGLVASWIVRKVSALVQWRVGPPLLQPAYDVAKLMGKEILVPQAAHKTVFMFAPLVGLAGVMLLSVMLWRITLAPDSAFLGDAIVAIYLMVLPSLALILGSSASGSPHASVGTGREMKLVMSYELPLVLAFIVVLIKAGGALSLSQIAASTPVWSISGMLAFLVALLCVQAKLGYIPFDMAEAETELGSGVIMEYSGALLAGWKLMQTTMLVALPLFLVMFFLGGFGAGSPVAAAAGAGKYVLVVVLIILIKNTNPRVRIDQAMRFFWVYCGLALALAVVLATIGEHYGIGWL
ncbi:MAG: respiratory chain complex I subunit 1 family protein [Planctomycetota bacterium]